MTEKEAWQVAHERFPAELVPWVRLERADFGWIARVEEPPSGPDGLIGRDLLAIGPQPDSSRFYPSMPPFQLRRRHTSWLAQVERIRRDSEDGTEPFPSFT
jgi:hypothetical protein